MRQLGGQRAEHLEHLERRRPLRGRRRHAREREHRVVEGAEVREVGEVGVRRGGAVAVRHERAAAPESLPEEDAKGKDVRGAASLPTLPHLRRGIEIAACIAHGTSQTPAWQS